MSTEWLRESKIQKLRCHCVSWSSKFSFWLSKRPRLHKFWFLGYNFLIFFFTFSEKSAENLFWLQCLMVNLECWKVAFLGNNQSYQSNFVLNWTKPKSKQTHLFTFWFGSIEDKVWSVGLIITQKGHLSAFKVDRQTC